MTLPLLSDLSPLAPTDVITVCAQVEVASILSQSKKMPKIKKPSPAKQRRSQLRLNLFNNMVTKNIFLSDHYPGLDIRPVKKYLGGGITYDLVWYDKYPEVDIAVLKEDAQLKLFKPDQTSIFENI